MSFPVSSFSWQVGSNLDKEGGSIEQTLKKAIQYGMYSFQFFLGSPYSYIRARPKKGDIENTIKLCKTLQITSKKIKQKYKHLVIEYIYLINLIQIRNFFK